MKHVLLVDDDSDDQLFFSAAWSEVGTSNKLTVVASYEAALEFLNNASQLPEICIFDINMPGRSGIELLREVRSQERFNGISIAMLTTSSDTRTRDMCHSLGADGFYTKPGSHGQLVKMISNILIAGISRANDKAQPI